MNDDDHEKAQGELITAKFEMLERMRAAGWLYSVQREGLAATVLPTSLGLSVMREIERLFFFGGRPATALEIVAFCRIVKEFENLHC
jgi:hypothetical protein